MVKARRRKRQRVFCSVHDPASGNVSTMENAMDFLMTFPCYLVAIEKKYPATVPVDDGLGLIVLTDIDLAEKCAGLVEEKSQKSTSLIEAENESQLLKYVLDAKSQGVCSLIIDPNYSGGTQHEVLIDSAIQSLQSPIGDNMEP